ncbi:sugar phosphate isomerase/epimerase [Lactovum odontotermitis]
MGNNQNQTKSQICANLLLFEKEWKAGAGQNQLLIESAGLGFHTVEVRQEYFRDLTEEIPQLAETAGAHDISLYLSVPDVLFLSDGCLNPKLASYLTEAKALKVRRLKLNIGNYEAFTGNLSETLLSYLLQGVQISVENDQSQENGTIRPIKKFLDAVHKNGLAIDFTFDSGNWLAAGEDPLLAAEILSEYTEYIHVKDMKSIDGKFDAVRLDTGQLPWRRILQRLPKAKPIALEYPAENHDLILKDLTLINSFLESV